MTVYTLNVTIDNSQLPELKKNGYTLCLARKVENNYNVIWKGDDEYLTSNEFQWDQQYKVFAARAFKTGLLVKAASNLEDIAYKQECIFDGVMQSAHDDPEGIDGTFKVVNQYDTVNFAVSTAVNGVYTAIYNSPSAIKGIASFTPLNEVRVWFGLQQLSETMFLDITGDSIDVKYGGEQTSRAILYDSDGNWRLL